MKELIEKIKYKEKFFRCNKYKDENTFQSEELRNEGLSQYIESSKQSINI